MFNIIKKLTLILCFSIISNLNSIDRKNDELRKLRDRVERLEYRLTQAPQQPQQQLNRNQQNDDSCMDCLEPIAYALVCLCVLKISQILNNIH